MSDYNKVINDENGISIETLVEMLNNVVKDSPVYVYEHREGYPPIPVKVTHISTQFGCLYLGTKKENSNRY